MQPNVPNNMPANSIASQDQYSSDGKNNAYAPVQGYQPAFPAQQMPANSIAPQDHHKPEKEKKKKKGRIRRFMKGYFLIAGILFTFAALTLIIIELLVLFFPMT